MSDQRNSGSNKETLPVARLLDAKMEQEQLCNIQQCIRVLQEQQQNAIHIDLTEERQDAMLNKDDDAREVENKLYDGEDTDYQTVMDSAVASQVNENYGQRTLAIALAPIVIIAIVWRPNHDKSTIAPSCHVTGFKCFETLDELYNAMDLFVLAESGATNSMTLEMIYGMPMSTWCVSQLANFLHLFSALDECQLWPLSTNH